MPGNVLFQFLSFVDDAADPERLGGESRWLWTNG